MDLEGEVGVVVVGLAKRVTSEWCKLGGVWRRKERVEEEESEREGGWQEGKTRG